MTVGLSSAAFYGLAETEEATAWLRAYPADCCEVFVQTPSEYSAAFGSILRQALGTLPCRSVHPLGTQFESQLFARSRRQAEDAFRLFSAVCDTGEALGAMYYVFHGPFGVHGPLKPERINDLPERFGRMREIAAARGLTILWENVCWCSLRTPQDALTLKKIIPDLGFVLDMKQAMRGGVDPFAMLDAMGERICHVHALDWTSAGKLVMPGEGTLDWRRLEGELRARGFTGSVILEPYGGENPDKIREGLAFLREIFG